MLFFSLNAKVWSQENAALCLTSDEKKAFSLRILQTNYMIAALSCNDMQDKYNLFIEKFGDAFIKNGKFFKNYFSRCYGYGSNKKMDFFITKTANDISLLSLENPRNFCARNFESISNVLELTTSDIENCNYTISYLEPFIPKVCP